MDWVSNNTNYKPKRIAFLCCSSRKLTGKFPACQLYSPSTLFRYTYEYIRQQNYDSIYILSAKYGLILDTTVIENYDKYLPDFTKEEYQSWLTSVLCACKDVDMDEAHFYTSYNYDKDLIPHLEGAGVKCVRYLGGLGIGQKVGWLKKNIKKRKLF